MNRPPGFQQPWQAKPQLSSADSGDSLADIVKNLTTSAAKFQKETRAGLSETRSGMKNLETQISYIATAINRAWSLTFLKNCHRNPR